MLGTFTSKQADMAAKKRARKKSSFIEKWPSIRRFFIYPVCAILLLIIIFRLLHTTLFPITTVEVIDPLQRVSHQQLQAQVAKDLDKGFFKLNLAEVQNDVLLSPWVKSAQVSRVWPNKIVISVQERTPLAQWDKRSLVDRDGQIFTPEKKNMPSGLPAFSGPQDAVQDMVNNYAKFSQVLAAEHLTIKSIHVSDRMSWSITLTNGLVVNLGRKEIIERLHRFVSVYGTIFASVHENAKYVDMRYPNAMAVHWQDNKG